MTSTKSCRFLAEKEMPVAVPLFPPILVPTRRPLFVVAGTAVVMDDDWSIAFAIGI
jgi:hypothetical protein